MKAYVPISNRRAERTISTIREPHKKTILANAEAWGDLLPWAIYGHRRRGMSRSYTSQFEFLYGVPAQMALEEKFSSDGDSKDSHRMLGALAVSGEHSKRNEIGNILRAFTNSELQVGETVLMAKGPSLNRSVKWSVLFIPDIMEPKL